METRKSTKIIEFAGECSFFQQPSLKTLDFPCFWPSEPKQWVVVVVAAVVGSDDDVDVRRPTCRHSKCLSHRCGRCFVHALVVATVVVVVVVGSDIDVNARRPTCRLCWFLQHILHSKFLSHRCGRCFVRMQCGLGGPLVWLAYQRIARFSARPGNTTN